MLLGIIIGAAAGFLQFLLLAKFTSMVTGGKYGNKLVLFGVSQFFLPLAALLICAFILRDSLLWAAVGIAASLIICAMVRFILAQKRG